MPINTYIKWIEIESGEVTFEEWVEKTNDVAQALGFSIEKDILSLPSSITIRLENKEGHRILLNTESKSFDLIILPQVSMSTKTEAISFLITEFVKYFRGDYLFHLDGNTFTARYRYDNVYEDPEDFNQTLILNLAS